MAPAPRIPFDEDSDPLETEDRLFYAFMATCITVIGMMFGALLFITLVALVQAMTMKLFLFWTIGLSVVVLISRRVYYFLIKKDLL